MIKMERELKNFLDSHLSDETLEKMDTAKKSKGNRKFWNYFLYILKTDKFQEGLIRLREKYGIPKKGLPETKLSFKSVPSFKLFKYNKKTSAKTLIVDLNELCRQFNLPSSYGPRMIRVLLYNFNINDFSYSSPREAICIINDLGIKKKTLFNKEESRHDLIDYPIAIQISPYASENDIVDFIKKSYAIKIKGLQEAYKIDTCKIGRIKEKKIEIQKSNEYIFKNKNLPYKKIATLVSKKFPASSDSINEGSVGKIISLENKIRKEV